MKTLHTPTPITVLRASSPAVLPVDPQARHSHRPRDFGVGYGNSSGYASLRRYAQNWGQPRFRCA